MEIQDLTTEMVESLVARRDSKRINKTVVRWVFKRYMQKIIYAIAHGYIVKERNDIKRRELIVSLKYTTLNDYKYHPRDIGEWIIRRAIRPKNSKFFLFHVHIAACDYHKYKNIASQYMKRKIRQYIEADHKLEIVPQ